MLLELIYCAGINKYGTYERNIKGMTTETNMKQIGVWQVNIRYQGMEEDIWESSNKSGDCPMLVTGENGSLMMGMGQ